MASLNKCHFIGRLVADPERKYLADETAVASFRIAVDRQFAKDKTDFIKVTAWRKLAEICDEYLKKGSLVYVEGSLRIEEYEIDGQKRWKTEINADNVQFLERKKD